jgi:glucose-6-phosphate isomerase
MGQRNFEIQTENMRDFQGKIQRALNEISKKNIVQRIWNKDWTVWGKEPKEISNRLGWLTSPNDSLQILPKIESLAQALRNEGYTHALLLGMGGSSLTPEVMGKVFKTAKGHLDLKVLDSTDPSAVLYFKRTLNPKRTVFIVSSKSGTTVETNSFFNCFYRWICESEGQKEAGSHFIAITDPGTPLGEMAIRYRFRSIFSGDPEIGGRFSALSVFGLVPGAIKGIDVQKILKSSQEMASLCRILSASQNPGVYLGTILGVLAQAGRDKATFVISRRIESFGAWLEQLIAESTGKIGKAILPVVEKPFISPDIYGNDRVFIFLKLRGDKDLESQLKILKKKNFPIIKICLSNSYSLGSQFFLWEMAASVAGYILGVNPFDQPNVDSAKKKTGEMIAAFKEKGVLPEKKPLLQEKGLLLYSEIPAPSIKEGLKAFLRQGESRGYIALQAFLEPSAEIVELLQNLRIRLQAQTKLATTFGFGPRYLHSTGQLHKGDRGNGLFIQLTADDPKDLPIPDHPESSACSLTFGVLKAAQALGDFEALKEAGRRAIRFHLGKDVKAALEKIIAFV